PAAAGRARHLRTVRRLVAGLGSMDPFEMDARTMAGLDVLSLTAAGLDEMLAVTTAGVVAPLLADARAPWPVDQLTLRGPSVAVVLTPLGPVVSGGTMLAAVIRPTGALALLEIRCREVALQSSAQTVGAGEHGPGRG